MLLALRLDGAIVASQATYDRLVADAAAIERLGADVQYHEPFSGQELLLRVTEAAALAIQAGHYHAWDCLEAVYGHEDVQVVYSDVADEWNAVLRLRGRYDVARLTALYDDLPGVEMEGYEIGGNGGDGPTTCVAREGETIRYVVDDRRGDCLSGCASVHADYFVSTAPGVVDHVASWDAGEPLPEWSALCAGF